MEGLASFKKKNFSAIFEVVSYLEEGSWGGGVVFPFLKSFFKKGLKFFLFLGFWHQQHESSYLNLKFTLMFMFLHSLCPKFFTLSSLTTQKFERICRFKVPFELLVYI